VRSNRAYLVRSNRGAHERRQPNAKSADLDHADSLYLSFTMVVGELRRAVRNNTISSMEKCFRYYGVPKTPP
jgi:hypothetical protein